MFILQQILAQDSLPDFQWFDKLSTKFFIRLGTDLVTVFLLIRIVYYRIYRKADLFLTFFAFNLIIFLITYLLNKVQMSIGAAFGLFAVFSMLRYRTEGLSAKDMTYLFVVISVGLISAIIKGGWDEIALINIMILLCVYLLESNWLIRREFAKTVFYDRIELILPEKRHELMQDLTARTGLSIHKIEIKELDFLKDSAQITIYYHHSEQKSYAVTSQQETLLAS